MKRFWRLTILLFLLISLAFIQLKKMPQASTMPKSVMENLPLVERDDNLDFGRHFREIAVEGSIIIYDLKNERFFEHNPQRNTTAFPPASTFKILNSLIALETGVIADEIAVLTWDGIERDLPQWNRDLNMKEAFKLSAVWFYQVLARRVRYDRMQEWVSQAEYGNKKIGGKDDIDKFWLDGELRITPQEQIQFIRRLYNNELPFSEKSLAIVKDIMINEKTPDYTIRAKTGWFGFGNDAIANIGWYVGYVETGDNVYFFATNIDIRNEKDGSARIHLTHRCLQDMGVL